jgi:dihydroxy-acid dehydratase
LTSDPLPADKKRVRSDQIKKGFERAPHRSLLRAAGLKDDDFEKPFIAVANSHVDIIPGHFYLQEYGRIAKDEIRKAGGVPFEFNTIGVDDGIAMGHAGMRYSLPSRELIADSIETMMNAHMLDALLCIPNCDKIVPGMVMGALRVDVPTVFVSGGPMRKGRLADGTPIDLTTAFEAVGKRARGQMTDAELYEIECNACPSGGSCSGMFTANSMNVLCEAMGIALPGNGTILALTPEREALVRRAARRAVEIAADERFRIRRIVGGDAIHNALVVDMAMGGSSNTVLHMLAIAREAGVSLDLRQIEDVASKVAHIAKVAPSLATVHMEDIHRAGGVPAVLHEIARRGGIVREGALTVSGETVGERIRGAEIRDREVIHTLETAYSPVGGLAVLFGNLAQEGREDRRDPARDAALHRKGDLLRLAGGGDRRDDGGQGEGGALRRHPLRGPEGRSGHAGDARPHRAHHGDGARREGRAPHRRPLLGRDARRLRRPRLAGGGGGRRDRARAGRRPRHDRRGGARAHGGRARRGAGAPAGVVPAEAEGDPLVLAAPLRPPRHELRQGRGAAVRSVGPRRAGVDH